MTTTASKKRKATRPQLVQKMDSWETPVPFTEDFKWPGAGKRITFTAESYHEWCRQFFPDIDKLPMLRHGKDDPHAEGNSIAVGEKFLFYRKELPLQAMEVPDFGGFCGFGFGFLSALSARPTRQTLKIYRGRNSTAFVAFSAAVGVPVLAAQKDMAPWMSLTPMEVLTQRGQLRRTRGNVGIAGCGLGWIAHRILERKQVTRLTIVDNDPAVLEFTGAPLKEKFGDKVEFVTSDAYEHDWSGYDVSVWDIWETYGGAEFDRKYREIRDTLRANGKVCVGWGE